MGLGSTLKTVVNPKRWFDGGGTVELYENDGEYSTGSFEEGSLEMAVAAQPWFDEFDLSDPSQAGMAQTVLNKERPASVG